VQEAFVVVRNPGEESLGHIFASTKLDEVSVHNDSSGAVPSGLHNGPRFPTSLAELDTTILIVSIWIALVLVG
jgi:hypothetical protein